MRNGKAARLTMTTAGILLLTVGCNVTGEGASGLAVDRGPLAVVDAGELEGAQGELAGEAVFMGIPFAAPPVGERRWQAPAPVELWEGVRDATPNAPACMQIGGSVEFNRIISDAYGADPSVVQPLGEVSEDCLYLNIWTPNWQGDQPLPVMVWIHGGGNTTGGTGEFAYDGANLARQGVVVVSSAYRLGPFGYLAHPALSAESSHGSSGNYGLLDQIEALRWVQRNGAVFGGDPTRVTIFGESAGGGNVGYLMTSPLAEGLFHGVISQSGGYQINDFSLLADAEARGETLVRDLGIDASGQTGPDTIDALREVPAQRVLTAAAAIPSLTLPPVDGWALPDVPARLFAEGRFAAVPLMIGANADEWTTLAPLMGNPDLSAHRSALRQVYGELAGEALALYDVDHEDAVAEANSRWQTEDFFLCPSRFMARASADYGGRTYLYNFSRVVPGAGGDQLGAYHGAEIPYAFDNLHTQAWMPLEPVDHELAATMAAYWVQFATSGDPNGPGRPEWPTYSAATDPHLDLGTEVVAGSGLRSKSCSLYDRKLAAAVAALD